MHISAWDTRIAWSVRQRRWWWSAWKASTDTELFGFVDTKEAAFPAMTAAIRRHEQDDTEPLSVPAYW